MAKYLRFCDWTFRHHYVSKLRNVRRREMFAKEIEELMGPDELLTGKDECSMVPAGTIIPLPDKERTRQLTLHAPFKVAKKHKKRSTTTSMRQMTLYDYFWN